MNTEIVGTKKYKNMKQKLIKVNEEHYIVVDDSEIKGGDLFVNRYNQISVCVNALDEFLKTNKSSIKKISHSTKPLEEITWSWENETRKSEVGFDKIKPISLLEIEEIILGYSIIDKAQEIAKLLYNPESHRNESFKSLLSVAYQEGFGAHQEIVKSKNEKVIELLTNITEWDSFKEHPIGKQAQRALELLLPPTEWNVKFNEQGKLELI